MKPHPEIPSETHMLLERTRHLFTHMVFAALVGGLGGCGAADDEHPAPVDEGEQVQLAERVPAALGEAGASGAACPSGVVRECRVMLSSQGNVVNCFVGVQQCSDEAWGPCQSLDDFGTTP
jgi:hypothetical protein